MCIRTSSFTPKQSFLGKYSHPMHKFAIFGTGLIGTSIALALKRAQPKAFVVGFDSHAASLDIAKSRGAIDGIGSPADLSSADVVILAIPVRQMPSLLSQLVSHVKPDAVVLDVGSTKQDVIAAARIAMGEKIAQFVPCHPIAGREQHGPAAADASLFDGKNVIITPLPENSDATLNRVRTLWTSIGMHVIDMTAANHDAVFAAVSHLPHLLAFALVDEMASRANAKTLFAHAASGFRDFTRIASSSPEMWRDVALNNRTALLAELDAFLTRASGMREALAQTDETALFELMQRAQTARGHWLSGNLEHFNDTYKDESA